MQDRSLSPEMVTYTIPNANRFNHSIILEKSEEIGSTQESALKIFSEIHLSSPSPNLRTFLWIDRPSHPNPQKNVVKES
jgi:hypothetical protein